MTERSYVPWHSVEHYLGMGQCTSYRLSPPSARPEVWYVIGDDGREIALHVELGRRHQPPRSPLASIRIDQIAERGMRMARIRTTQATLIRDFHDLLNAVADRIVGQERTLDQALAETVRAWSALLDRPRGLSTEQRIGLMGELAALASIARSQDWSTAVESWKGPRGEEHDFGLAGFDLEVKTTSAERRRHGIHGLGQLTPSVHRPLWLLSLQVTRGGSDGRTLSSCVDSVRSRVGEHAPACLDLLDEQLIACGWDAGLRDDERWRLRTKPLALPVDGRLPRLDPQLIPEPFRNHIANITYTVDVTDIEAPTSPPHILTDLHLP
ncbi:MULTISPECIES: PD-(D/E)XK motif protein [Streptomyces]|uniref:PD-(D/E)XK motif protein n=1 Tax=Streptomyces TaxID=1883 RepID=UPI0007CD958A